jgi:hypothetical protein
MQPFSIKSFKGFCGLLALSYLAAAIIPAELFFKYNGPRLVPDWAGHAIYFGYFLLFGVVFYGLQYRIPIYWKLTPILIGIFISTYLIGSLWSALSLSWPLAPFTFVIIFFLLSYFIFIAWWRKQKSYFEYEERFEINLGNMARAKPQKDVSWITLLRLERILRTFSWFFVPFGVAAMLGAMFWATRHGSPVPDFASGQVHPLRVCAKSGTNCTATVYVAFWQLALIWSPGVVAFCGGIALFILMLIKRFKLKS